MRYQHIYRAIMEMPWAIQRSKLEAILAVLDRAESRTTISAEEIATVVGASGRSTAPIGSVQVINVFGVISQRMNLLDETSGGTSTEQLTKLFRGAMLDPNVGSILLNIDSPGGGVYGIAELADEIRAARGQKRVVGLANSLSASAAYWLMSAAEEAAVVPGGEVGSIGVFTMHTDFSKMEEMMGMKTTLISAGEFKTEASPYAPLSEEARAAIQARIDAYYAMFTGAVAKGRGVTRAQVESGFGQGRVVGSADAHKLGMVDAVMTFDQVLQKMQSGKPIGAARADSGDDPIEMLADGPLEPAREYSDGVQVMNTRKRLALYS